jgi:DNA-binding transcriptional LysR family regulator
MELRHLRYFVKVASELHFGRAADQLGISQPPLSQQIRLLEQELGVDLFERTSRRVRLTVAGRLFLDEANATLAQADHAMSIARRAATGEVGELSIGLSPSALFVPAISEAIGEFRHTFPDVHLDISERDSATQRDAIAAGTLDIGLIRSGRRPLLPDGVGLLPVVQDRMYVALPANHRLAKSCDPIAVAEIAGEAMVHYPYDRDGFQEDLRLLYETIGFRPWIVQEVREMTTLLGLVAAGVGITVLAGPLRRLRVDTIRFRELSDASASSVMWLIHSKARPRPACLAFLAITKRRMEATGLLDAVA